MDTAERWIPLSGEYRLAVGQPLYIYVDASPLPSFGGVPWGLARSVFAFRMRARAPPALRIAAAMQPQRREMQGHQFGLVSKKRARFTFKES